MQSTLNAWKNYFNPRTLQESATTYVSLFNEYEAISIHAPYKRVRPPPVYCQPVINLFQSTHPTRECDSKSTRKPKMPDTFQSTHPTRECDSYVASVHKRPHSDFNPRTLQESATQRPCLYPTSLQNFNPRTLQESATNLIGLATNNNIFQSTHPTRECDCLRPLLTWRPIRLFQSTHPTRECDY